MLRPFESKIAAKYGSLGHFHILNYLCNVLAVLYLTGSDVSLRATSTRLIGGCWWVFSLFLISTYTANLAAFLTVERVVSPIENVDQLSTQTAIQYGTLANGSTMLFFKVENTCIIARYSGNLILVVLWPNFTAFT